MRAVLHFEDFQTIRIPWVPIFEIPWLPELFLSTRARPLDPEALLHPPGGPEGDGWTCALVEELVARFQRPADTRGPIEYYREMVSTQIWPAKRARLEAVYRTPITAPATLIWAAKDGALSARVAMNSELDAGLPGGSPAAPGRRPLREPGGPRQARARDPAAAGPVAGLADGPERAAATARRPPDEGPGQPDEPFRSASASSWRRPLDASAVPE